jgi:hypothetical protein
LHEKYGKDGLVAVSVHLQDPPDTVSKPEGILKFLKKKKAAFTNVMLDEPGEVWQEKFHVKTLPSVFVFNKEGKWKQFKEDEKAYDKVKKLVVDLLKSN